MTTTATPDTGTWSSGAAELLAGDTARQAASERPPRPRPAWVPTLRLAAVLTVVGAAHLVLAGIAQLPAAGWILVAADAAILVLCLADGTGMARDADLTGGRSRPRIFSLRVVEDVTVTVTNRSRHRVRGMLRLPLPDALGTPVDTVAVRVPRRGTATVHFPVVGVRRGRHTCAALELRVKTPLGLLTRRYHVCVPDVVAVYPDVKAAKRLELAVRHRRRDDAGLRRTRMIGLGTDFDSLREYRPDDDVRLIDWHATARRGTPISRQYRVERNQNVLFVVDAGRLMAAPIATAPVATLFDGEPAAPEQVRQGLDRVDVPIRRLDLALNAATALAYASASLDDKVGYVAFDAEVRGSISPGRRSRDGVVAAMCTLEPRRVESDYALAFRIVGGMKRSLVVLFTDVLDESAAMPLLAAIPSLARHHLVVAAAVVDPDIAAAAEQLPTTSEAAFEQAAALDLLRRRRLAASRLRSHGVDVVEAPPERFSARLVDTYLRMKAHGRL